MTIIMKGKPVVDEIQEKIKSKVNKLAKQKQYPKLGIVRLGNDPEDKSYEKSIVKNCDNLRIQTHIVEKDKSINTYELVKTIEELNKDSLISGILIFMPLPSHIDEKVIRNTIDPNKDVDCIHPLNLAKVLEGDLSGFVPCTPKAAIEILIHYDIHLEGKDLTIVNRSTVVGKPLAMMLLEKNATVTICHSKTKNLKNIIKNSDIVIVALGSANYFDNSYFKSDSILVDIGTSIDKNGKLSGDIDYDDTYDMVRAITPVPGGVGRVTTSILLKHVVDSRIKMNK